MNLICYLCNGYPSIEKSVEMAKLYEQAGCDIIEIDFPSRNPYLESELIQSRMAKALEACDDYSGYFLDPDGYPWEVAYAPFLVLDENGCLHPNSKKTQLNQKN